MGQWPRQQCDPQKINMGVYLVGVWGATDWSHPQDSQKQLCSRYFFSLILIYCIYMKINNCGLILLTLTLKLWCWDCLFAHFRICRSHTDRAGIVQLVPLKPKLSPTIQKAISFLVLKEFVACLPAQLSTHIGIQRTREEPCAMIRLCFHDL